MTRRFFSKLLLVVVAVFGLLVLSSMLSAQGHSEDAFERVKEVQEKHTDRLMAIEGVEGTAVGLDESDRPAVKVFLENPGVRGIPRELDGVPVHPVVTGKFYALPKPDNPGGGKGGNKPVDPKGRFDRPVPIGVSTGNWESNSAGTIACRVKDEAGNVYALSNNHVYALENTAGLGSYVLQPGVYDGGKYPEDVLGTLYSYAQIIFPPSDYDNLMDAAIALSSTANLGNATPSDGYGRPQSATAGPLDVLDQPVKKYGRTTGLTKGKVVEINAIVYVTYDSGVARFAHQITITPGSFSAPGDSGSLVVVDGKGKNRAQDRKPLGLLFAGNGSRTLANPIDPVLHAFGVTIDGE